GKLPGLRVRPRGRVPGTPGEKAHEKTVSRNEPERFRPRVGCRGERVTGVRPTPAAPGGFHGGPTARDRGIAWFRARRDRSGTRRGSPGGPRRITGTAERRGCFLSSSIGRCRRRGSDHV